ncbi:MAG: Crp/Fnr family transcriptional regulator [Spirochaeta sp.]|jgi:CRP-like cAMP-binding protein|nr:Crp/Fnr family transcriptional regulator [Spirochaeta sp.]
MHRHEPAESFKYNHALSAIPLFEQLSDRELTGVAEHLFETIRTAEAEHEIVSRGTPMTALLILLDGNAHAEIITGDGHAMIVENFHGPDVIATAMLFAPNPHFPVTVVADSACAYAWLGRETLLTMSQQNRSVLEALLGDAGRRTAFLAARLRLTQFASLRQRIAVFISEEKIRTDRNGVDYIHVSHSRQELADMFGVARPSLSRELGKMADEGMIWVSGATVQVLDRNAIEALVSGCD